MKWSREYIKTDFPITLFIDECHAILDGPDRWCNSWMAISGNHADLKKVEERGLLVLMWWTHRKFQVLK